MQYQGVLTICRASDSLPPSLRALLRGAGILKASRSILHVPVGVMDELPVQLLGLLGVELLAAIRALEFARHPHSHIDHSAVARHGPLGDHESLVRHGRRG